jgi:hypothetical protein
MDPLIQIKPSGLLALEFVFQWLQPLGKLLNILIALQPSLMPLLSL